MRADRSPLTRPAGFSAMWLTVAGLVVLASPALAQDDDQPAPEAPGNVADNVVDNGEATVAQYLAEMEELKLLDIETGNKDTLRKELRAAEKLLHSGAHLDAAVALYGIVESPRYEGFEDFVEYQNAQYDLAVALALAGAYESSLTYLARAMKDGPNSLYFAPAHRRAVDIALETRDYEGVLTRLTSVETSDPLPTEASGEQAYLRARVAYSKGDLKAAEDGFSTLSRKSRLYSSSLYLRGVINTRQGRLPDAAEALCEIVDTPDNDKFTFVVDNRYFSIKDLARLGLGRIAHEKAEYDDAYYHYFQIPDDSDRLPEALFEAGWSMYQKRELATARDLIKEFIANFPESPLAPEARLLAGYIELADCEFEAAQKHYDDLVADLDPVLKEMDEIVQSPERIDRLFSKALVRWRAERAEPDKRLKAPSAKPFDRVLGLLRLDPRFVRLHDAMYGLQRASGDAPHVVRAWRSLGRRVAKTRVGAVSEEASGEQEDAQDANNLVTDVERLRLQIIKARQDLSRGEREKTLPADVAKAERERLRDLEQRVEALAEKARGAAGAADAELVDQAAGSIAPMLRADLKRARKLRRRSRSVHNELKVVVDGMAVRSLHKLHQNMKRIHAKAKLGKIDAVIGQKGKLDIEVQDLAAGRWPPELHGRLWEEGLIGDDEEYWPFQGEFWADEYEGWR